jgi:signal transduction histidine kinase
MATPIRDDAVNILLVDDQPAKLLTYQTILSELGDHLISANSASEALQHLLKLDIAVVLVDVCMPDLDGYELAAMIRQHPRFRRTSIIFVSAIMLTDLDRLRGYESGAVDYVPVPVVPEILRAKVGVFADLYRKTQALERLNAELESRVAERTAALQRTTEALQEAALRKDEFLAMLAHELRNPLAPIRTAVQLLRLKELSEVHRSSARDIIERQVEHLVSLIDDLLDVSRITRGMISLKREVVPLGAIVARAVETSRPAIDARRHTLTVDLPAELITVEGDATRLVQVVANILHNAAKFTEPGGRIDLEVSREGGEAVLRVTDNGIGIPAQALPRVFDLFTQVQSKAERPEGGLGIGLALVRRLTEMHGGAVAVHSDGPGAGTVVTLRLPVLSAERSPDAEPAAAEAPPVAPRRILVADDNDDAARSLALQLQMAGHDVRTAFDGVEALALADQFEPQVVLLDLGMPRLDGFETAREMRRRPWGAGTTLIALTGWGQPHDRQRTDDAGFDVHLVKPVSADHLFQAIAAGPTPRPSAAPGEPG